MEQVCVRSFRFRFGTNRFQRNLHSATTTTSSVTYTRSTIYYCTADKNQQAALCESIMGHVELLDRCLALPFWCVSPPLDSRKAAQLEIMITFQEEAQRGTRHIGHWLLTFYWHWIQYYSHYSRRRASSQATSYW